MPQDEVTTRREKPCEVGLKENPKHAYKPASTMVCRPAGSLFEWQAKLRRNPVRGPFPYVFGARSLKLSFSASPR